MYDADHDGALSAAELEKCPALKQAAKRYSGPDGKITAESIAARIAKWNEEKTAIFILPVNVRMDNQPLADATVTFDPEAFLVGANLAPVVGKSDQRGDLIPKLDNQNHKGLPPGLYKVRISKLVERQRVDSGSL